MENIIVNLTQHQATEDQIAEGVIEVHPSLVSKKKELLTFNYIPSPELIMQRAERLVRLIPQKYEGAKVMIGGAPYLMSTLEYALRVNGYIPVYAFSQRESVEKEVDGKVIKTNTFKHKGFIEV